MITTRTAKAIGGTITVSSSAMLKTVIERLVGPATVALKTEGTPKKGVIRRL